MAKPPAYFDPSRTASNRLESASEAGSAFEMRPWGIPSHYSSQASMTMSAYGSRSMLSMYTPSMASYILPVVTDAPDFQKKPDDNWGFACCSLFCNPVFGLVAILLAGLFLETFLHLYTSMTNQHGRAFAPCLVGPRFDSWSSQTTLSNARHIKGNSMQKPAVHPL